MQFDGLLVDSQGSKPLPLAKEYKVHANRSDVVLREGVVLHFAKDYSKANENARLAYRGVADKDQFEEEVASC